MDIKLHGGQPYYHSTQHFNKLMNKKRIKILNSEPKSNFLISISNGIIYNVSYIDNIEKMNRLESACYIVSTSEVECFIPYTEDTLMKLMIQCKYSPTEELELLHSTNGLMNKEYKTFIKIVKSELNDFIKNFKK